MKMSKEQARQDHEDRNAVEKKSSELSHFSQTSVMYRHAAIFGSCC
jgi:hypothetical protein